MRRLICAIVISAIIPLGIAGCLQMPYAGVGPLTLSKDAYVHLIAYQSLESPGAFAISKDGSIYGWSYCPQLRCMQDSQIVALSACKAGGGVDCKLLANGKSIVWNGEVTYPTLISDGPNRASANQRRAEAEKIDVRPISIIWQGHPDIMGGTAEISRNKDKITLWSSRRNLSCQGVVSDVIEGEASWAISCTDGQTAAGKMKVIGRNEGSTGTGRDSIGNLIQFTVGPRVTND